MFIFSYLVQFSFILMKGIRVMFWEPEFLYVTKISNVFGSAGFSGFRVYLNWLCENLCYLILWLASEMGKIMDGSF